MKPHLPQALKLSLATLLAGSVYVMQNAEHYASKITDTDLPGAESLAHALNLAAEYSGLTEWNAAQRSWLEKWTYLVSGETEEELEEEEEDTPAPSPAEPPAPTPEPQAETAPTPEPPAPAPAEKVEIPADAETDPLPAEGHGSTEPPAPLLDTAPLPIATAEPLPWPPAPQPHEPSMEEPIEPTPPPAPLVEDVTEPDSAPTPAAEQDTPAITPDATEQVATETTPEPAPAIEIPKQAPPVRCKIVFMGDSLMEDMGPRAHRRLNHRKGLQFILSAKYSTGLCRADFFDWPAHMREVLAEHKPNFLFVFIGANDGQPFKQGSTYVPTGSKQWFDLYGQEMQKIVDTAKEHGTKVIWIGLPVMGKHARQLAETSRIQREHCERMGISFVDSNETFADEQGEFIAFRKGADGKIQRLRRQDKVHLSPEGNHALIDQLLPVLEKNLAEFSATHPELCLTDDEAKKTAPAPLLVTVKFKPSSRKEPTRKKKRKKQ